MITDISRGRWCTGGPAEDSLVTWDEADTRVCLLDRAGASNELFRFSTTEQKWEQLDAPRVSGSPPSRRSGHGMVAVGSDLYVFGGYVFDGSVTQGEEKHCAAGRLLGACQIVRGHSLRAMPLCLSPHLGLEQRSAVPVRNQGLVTRDGTSPLFWHREVHRMITDISRGRWCTGCPCRG
jgi:hypothetical protein